MNLFMIYSYMSRIFWLFMEITPPFLRDLLFKILFAKKGRGGHIDYGCYFRYMNKIEIGENVSINRGCRFFASHHVKDSYIKIGNNVAFGPNVTIFGAGHDYTRLNLPDTAGTVVVSDNVWIGGNSTILQGVVIGEGAVVAAGSVVSKNVNPYTVVGGGAGKSYKN